MGRGRKSGWAWSETHENQNEQNALLRFILEENGSRTKKWMQNTEKADFHVFACIKWGVVENRVRRDLRHLKTEIN